MWYRPSNSPYSFILGLTSVFPYFGTGNRRFQAVAHDMSSCIETGSRCRYAGSLTVRAAWGFGTSRARGGDGLIQLGRWSERIVGDVRSVEPEGVAVQLPPVVAEGYRTETAAQTCPRRGFGYSTWRRPAG